MEHDSEELRQYIAGRLQKARCTAGLSKEARDLMVSASVNRMFKTNDAIWEMGDPGEFLAVITSGLVEIIRYSSRDEEMAMGLFGPCDVIGISAVMKKITFPGSARVLVKNTEVIKIFIRPLLHSKSSAVPEINGWIREMLLHHEQILRDKIDVLNGGDIESRIYELLVQLIRRFGIHQSPLRHVIPFALTRSQIARLTDARVETVIRILSRWQKEKLVVLTKEETVIPNLPLLEKTLRRNTSL